VLVVAAVQNPVRCDEQFEVDDKDQADHFDLKTKRRGRDTDRSPRGADQYSGGIEK
jgi:hypothetical protein